MGTPIRGLSAFKITIASTMFLLLGACDKIQDLYLVNPETVRGTNDGDQAKVAVLQPINLDEFRFPGADTSDNVAYKLALVSKKDRNRLQIIVKERSDEICHAHQSAILANSATFNFATNTISTILSGASAAIGGVAAKTALSTSSAATNAIGANSRAEFYQSILAPAVIRKIGELRKAEWDSIKNRRNSDHTNYTIDEALHDLNIYHAQCSFYVGITALANDEQKEMSFGEINNRISTLRAEAVELGATHKTLTDAEQTELANGIMTQIRMIEAEINRLMVLRQSAPGSADNSNNFNTSSGDNADSKGAESSSAPVKKVTSQ